MEKKEYHRANLPHYQQPGQAYFVTWSLKDAIPAKAMKDYSDQLASLRLEIATSKRDGSDNSVYLEDILKSVKQFSATEINKLAGIKGSLWHKESWDTTIRDDRHLYAAIEYTRNNPVEAGLVTDCNDWKGTVVFEK